MEKFVFPLYFNCSIRVINAKSKQFSLQIRSKAFICASKEVRDILTHAARGKVGYCIVGQFDKSRTLHADSLTKSSGLVYFIFTSNINDNSLNFVSSATIRIFRI